MSKEAKGHDADVVEMGEEMEGHAEVVEMVEEMEGQYEAARPVSDGMGGSANQSREESDMKKEEVATPPSEPTMPPPPAPTKKKAAAPPPPPTFDDTETPDTEQRNERGEHGNKNSLKRNSVRGLTVRESVRGFKNVVFGKTTRNKKPITETDGQISGLDSETGGVRRKHARSNSKDSTASNEVAQEEIQRNVDVVKDQLMQMERDLYELSNKPPITGLALEAACFITFFLWVIVTAQMMPWYLVQWIVDDTDDYDPITGAVNKMWVFVEWFPFFGATVNAFIICYACYHVWDIRWTNNTLPHESDVTILGALVVYFIIVCTGLLVATRWAYYTIGGKEMKVDKKLLDLAKKGGVMKMEYAIKLKLRQDDQAKNGFSMRYHTADGKDGVMGLRYGADHLESRINLLQNVMMKPYTEKWKTETWKEDEQYMVWKKAFDHYIKEARKHMELIGRGDVDSRQELHQAWNGFRKALLLCMDTQRLEDGSGSMITSPRMQVPRTSHEDTHSGHAKAPSLRDLRETHIETSIEVLSEYDFIRKAKEALANSEVKKAYDLCCCGPYNVEFGALGIDEEKLFGNQPNQEYMKFMNTRLSLKELQEETDLAKLELLFKQTRGEVAVEEILLELREDEEKRAHFRSETVSQFDAVPSEADSSDSAPSKAPKSKASMAFGVPRALGTFHKKERENKTNKAKRELLRHLFYRAPGRFKSCGGQDFDMGCQLSMLATELKTMAGSDNLVVWSNEDIERDMKNVDDDDNDSKMKWYRNKIKSLWPENQFELCQEALQYIHKVMNNKEDTSYERSGYELATGGVGGFSQAQFRDANFDNYLLAFFYGVEKVDLQGVAVHIVYYAVGVVLALPVAYAVVWFHTGHDEVRCRPQYTLDNTNVVGFYDRMNQTISQTQNFGGDVCRIVPVQTEPQSFMVFLLGSFFTGYGVVVAVMQVVISASHHLHTWWFAKRLRLDGYFETQLSD